MHRRRLVVVIACLAAAPHAFAQQATKVFKIGFLSPFTSTETASWYAALRGGLRDLGWTEGTNITIDYRCSEGRDEDLARLAAELVALKVDVIVASITTDALAAKNATSTIPIVVASAGDPVQWGLVNSLGRPNGNVTGLTNMASELMGKRLDLMREIVPGLSRLAVLWDPQNIVSEASWKESQSAARRLGLHLISLKVNKPADFDGAFKLAIKSRAQALVVAPGALLVNNEKRLAALANEHRLPSMFHLSEFVHYGGLAAYGPERTDLFRRAAIYVDKILKGAKPADLPFEQASKVELALNLKTAKGLGLVISRDFLARVDVVVH